MFRPVSRLVARSSTAGALPRPIPLTLLTALPRATPARRLISTAPPHKKSRSWKSLVGRLGLAGAVIYFYNTTELFAEEPQHAVHQVPEINEETEQLPTIEALARERQQRKAELAAAQKDEASAQESASAGGVQDLENEAGQQGAFNPETGEINWDCPCLGGMATGPCGEQFKAAFSCFVYSNEEPKGMDCVDKFKDMQNCFREYPDVYGNELESDEDDDVTGDDDLGALADTLESAPSDKAAGSRSEPVLEAQKERSEAVIDQNKKQQALGGSDEVIPRAPEQLEKGRELSESDEVIPKAAHDERGANEEKK